MSTVSKADIVAHRQQGSWRNLERVVLDIIVDVRKHASETFNPVLGGGTRLMLAMDHRISHDIDLFIRDPQWLGYISPRLNDRVEEWVTGYDEAADYLKLNLADGEIDFIVRGSLLDLPIETSSETALPLEPVAEVLAKKLFFRGAMLTPRDLFDWWSIETRLPEAVPWGAMGALLETRHDGIARMLDVLSKSPKAQTLWSEILAPDKPDFARTIAWGKAQLDRYAASAPRKSGVRSQESG